MSSQAEQFRKAVEDASLEFASLDSSASYVMLFVERTVDAIPSALYLSHFFVKRNLSFGLRFVDPLSSQPVTGDYAGAKLTLGCFDTLSESFSEAIEISSSSYCSAHSRLVLNPHLFGLNGVAVCSVPVLVHLLLKDWTDVPPVLIHMLAASSLASQQTIDVDKLAGFNAEMMASFVSEGRLRKVGGLKIPLSEGLELSEALSLTVEPFVPGVTGDRKGARSFVNQLIHRAQLKKSGGIIAGNEAALVSEWVSKLRAQAGFDSVSEQELVGSVIFSDSVPPELPYRSLVGMAHLVEALVSMGEYPLLFRMVYQNTQEVHEKMYATLLEYASQVSNGVKQVLQAQEYISEAQNAIHVLSPQGVNRQSAMRVAKTLSRHTVARGKPVMLVVTTDSTSYIAGATSRVDVSFDLGKIFATTARKYKGSGRGSSFASEAIIPSKFVEGFLDEVDLHLKS